MYRSSPDTEISLTMCLQMFLTATKPSHILTLVCQIIFLCISANLFSVNQEGQTISKNYKSVDRWQYSSPTEQYMEQQLLRDAVTQDNNITLEECTSSATYFSKCVDEVVITNTVRSFPNQKAWMNREVWAFFRAEKPALESDDKEAHITARARLKAGIKEAKRTQQTWQCWHTVL